MLEQLKKEVFAANMRLYKSNLIILTWGNVSGIDRDLGLVVIKPSGVSYETMTEEDMVVVDLDGNVVEGKYKPSSDTKTHLELYKNFPLIGGVVHTHSTFATSFAQAKRNIVTYGTTHADTFYGDVPCSRDLSKEEVEQDYELNTGRVIVETFASLDYEAVPGVLVSSHGPFTWGKDSNSAVTNAIILEEIAKMAYLSLGINNQIKEIEQHLKDKHYFRKHGKNAYYGQGDK